MATIPAGRINRLFGTDGGVMLSLYAAFPATYDPAQTPLLVTIDALEVPLWCERFERRGATGAVVTFADLDNERRATELLGLEFRIRVTDETPEDEEFYLEDLIGFAVTAEETGTDSSSQPAPDPQPETAPAHLSQPHPAMQTEPSACPGSTPATAVQPDLQPAPTPASARGNDAKRSAACKSATGEATGGTSPGRRFYQGTIVDFYDNEANPLFELEIAGKSVLVPAVEEFIAHIDFERRTIRLILPDGLLDL